MGKWEKFSDDLADEDLVKPLFSDVVVDVIDPADPAMPPELRGSQVIERRHASGKTEGFFCRPDGVTLPEAEANALVERYRLGGAAARASAPVAAPAPIPSLTLLDQLAADGTVPPKLRGAKLYARGDAFFYVTRSGEEIPKDVAESLLEAHESPEVTGVHHLPVPSPAPALTMIDRLAADASVPPKLRGAKLYARGETFFYVTETGEEIPKDVAEDLLEAYESPEVTGQHRLPVPAPGPAPALAPVVIDRLGTGADVPPLLRGAALVERPDGFFYLRADGEAIPKDVAEDLLESYEPPAPAPVAPAPVAPAPVAPAPVAPAASWAQHVKPVGLGLTPGAEAVVPRSAFGFEDGGPVTIPEAFVPETLEERPAATVPPVDRPPADPVALPDEDAWSNDVETTQPFGGKAIQAILTRGGERLRDERLDRQLADALELVRREIVAGGFDVESACPPQARIEEAMAQLVSAMPEHPWLARMVQRSIQIGELLQTVWGPETAKDRKEIARDLESGTLLLAAVNPSQLKGLDVLGLITLIRLRRAGAPRVIGEVARALRTRLVAELTRVLKVSEFSDHVLLEARTAPAVVRDGKLATAEVKRLVGEAVARQVTASAAEVLASYRDQGFAFPGLPQLVEDLFRGLGERVGERLIEALH